MRHHLFNHLDQIGISHTTHEHAPIYSVHEGLEINASLPGGHTKNLFLKDKAKQLFLICALGSTQIKLNKLHTLIGCKRLSFGNEHLLFETLGVRPGSVTVFSILNNLENTVQLVLDKALFDDPLVNFHPLQNSATTTMSSKDLLVFAKSTGHTPLILDFKALQDSEAAPT